MKLAELLNEDVNIPRLRTLSRIDVITFKEFLVEAGPVPELDAAIAAIKKDCQPFLQACKRPLYRGMRGSSLKHLSGAFYKGTVRKNRRPRDSSAELHRLLDAFFMKRFGLPLRSSALFCSLSSEIAVNYDYDGEGETFLIFPIGEFHYVWSKVIHDAYTVFEEMWGTWEERTTKQMIGIIKELKIELPFLKNNSEAYDFDEISPKDRLRITARFLEKYGKTLYKFDADINSAKNAEIMAICDEYYAINEVWLRDDLNITPQRLMKLLLS